MITEHITPECTCPTCGYRFDRAALCCGSGKRIPPIPGDLSLCLKCGEVLEFMEDLTTTIARVSTLMMLNDKESELIEHTQELIRKKRFIK